jgi:hypothetical protein
MFRIVKCRGMLLKAMNKRVQHISFVSIMLFTIPLIIVCAANPPESNLCRIPAMLLLWYLISLFSLNKVGYEDSGDLHKIFTLPVWISLKLSVLIFKIFLIRKYPEIEEEHFERYQKLKRLKSKINRRHLFGN